MRRHIFAVMPLTLLTVLLLSVADGAASSLPFHALDDDTSQFTASGITKPYDINLNQLLDFEKKSRVDLTLLDMHGWFPANDVPYDPNAHEMFQWAEEDMPTDPLTPEEEVAGESGTAGVSMGIPSPVAVGGAILGGVGLLVSILADFF